MCPKATFPRFFPTVVGILYSLTEPWIPSMKVKGPQRMPAISEPHSLKGQRSCMDDGRCGYRCGLRLEIRTGELWRVLWRIQHEGNLHVCKDNVQFDDSPQAS